MPQHGNAAPHGRIRRAHPMARINVPESAAFTARVPLGLVYICAGLHPILPARVIVDDTGSSPVPGSSPSRSPKWAGAITRDCVSEVCPHCRAQRRNPDAAERDWSGTYRVGLSTTMPGTPRR